MHSRVIITHQQVWGSAVPYQNAIQCVAVHVTPLHRTQRGAIVSLSVTSKARSLNPPCTCCFSKSLKAGLALCGRTCTVPPVMPYSSRGSKSYSRPRAAEAPKMDSPCRAQSWMRQPSSCTTATQQGRYSSTVSQAHRYGSIHAVKGGYHGNESRQIARCALGPRDSLVYCYNRLCVGHGGLPRPTCGLAPSTPTPAPVALLMSQSTNWGAPACHRTGRIKQHMQNSKHAVCARRCGAFSSTQAAESQAESQSDLEEW